MHPVLLYSATRHADNAVVRWFTGNQQTVEVRNEYGHSDVQYTSNLRWRPDTYTAAVYARTITADAIAEIMRAVNSESEAA